MAKKQPYVYTKLKDLEGSKNVNLFGVIIEVVKNHGTVRNNKVHSIIYLADESLPAREYFRMHFFLPSSDTFIQWKEGSVLRLHRVQVEHFNGVLDGRIFRSNDIAFFLPYSRPFSTGENFTYTDYDEARAKALIEWMEVKILFEMRENKKLIVTNSQRVTIGTAEESFMANKLSEASSSNEPKEMISEENVQGNSEEFNFIKPTLRLNPFNKKYQDFLSGSSSAESSGQNYSALTSCAQKRKRNSSASRVEKKSKPNCPVKANGVSITASSVQADVNGQVLVDGSPKIRRLSSDKSKQETSLKAHLGIFKDPYVCLGSKVSPPENDIRIETKSKISGQEQLQSKASGTPESSNRKCDKTPSLFAEAGSCPGLQCSGSTCRNEPILLSDDDPRLAGFNEESLITEGEGDIPAADEDGCIIPRPTGFAPCGAGREKLQPQRVSILDLLNFKWPEYRAKVQIVKMKPSLQALDASPKNLLSGLCGRCSTFTFYKLAKWRRDVESSVQRALCPHCLEAGQEKFLGLQFRIRLTVTDTWGTQMDVHIFRKDACQFLGTSTIDFLQNDVIRKETVKLLTETVKSKRYILLKLCRISAPGKPVCLVKNCCLKDILS